MVTSEQLKKIKLILTDIDSIGDNNRKVLVSEGKTSSNATIKWWYKKVNSLPESTSVTLSKIIELPKEKKSYNKCHIEYQIRENGLCGRSLEEAIKNVNRNYYDLDETSATESDLEFDEKSKTWFVKFYYTDYKGTKKQKKKRRMKIVVILLLNILKKQI